MYPVVIPKQCNTLGIHYSTWTKHGGKWRDRRRGKKLPVFFFVNEHQHKHEASSYKKASIFKVIAEEKQQLVDKKDADNIRKVLCKSFISWFSELNLCSYKYRVHCFDALRLSIFFCCYWSMLKWKSRNIIKHLMSGPSGNQLVLFSLESWCFPRLRLRYQNSGKQN